MRNCSTSRTIYHIYYDCTANRTLPIWPDEIYTHVNHQTGEIYLKEINKLIQTYQIPDQWQIGEITRLHRVKGAKGKCSNERASNFGKLLDLISMTEAQSGRQKSKATVDHLLRINDTIRHLLQNHSLMSLKPTTRNAILCFMQKEGTDLPSWKLVKEVLSVIQYVLLMD